ncbi:MAG: hypothetical protein JHC95_07580 [Solirubrobacteraceae bacterium]|nr:hypothetical protein [Solirubrobacteraceae bacterium]
MTLAFKRSPSKAQRARSAAPFLAAVVGVVAAAAVVLVRRRSHAEASSEPVPGAPQTAPSAPVPVPTSEHAISGW